MVWVTDANCQARVLSPAQRPRSYVVETPGGVLQRNRRHLVRFSPSDKTQTGETPDEQPSLPESRPSSELHPAVDDPAEPPQEEHATPRRVSAPFQGGVLRTRYGRCIKPPRRLNL